MTLLPNADTTWWLGLPIALWDGVVGGVIGGILAVVAGVVANVVLSRLEEGRSREQRRRERNAAVRAVIVQFATNETTIDTFLLSPAIPKDVTDSIYRTVQVLLLSELPQGLNVALIDGFEEVDFVRHEMNQMRAKTQASWTAAEIASLSQSQGKWLRIRTQLEQYLELNPMPV